MSDVAGQHPAGVARAAASSSSNSLSGRLTCSPRMMTSWRSGSSAHVADLDRLVARAVDRLVDGRAAQHGAHAGHQLAEAVRLGDVVVGADLEPDDRVDLGALGGDHDDRDMRARAASRGTRRCPTPSAASRRAARGRGARCRTTSSACSAVARDLHAEALALQPDRQRLDERLLVLDDEHRAGRPPSLLTTFMTDRPPRLQRRPRKPERERGARRLPPTRPDTAAARGSRRRGARSTSPRPVPPVSRLRARSTR